jgi:dolichol-phosphate mannosyltransferase
VLISVLSDADDLFELHEEIQKEFAKLDGRAELLYLIGGARSAAAEQARLLQQRGAGCVRVFQFSRSDDRAGMLAAGIEHARGQVLFTLPARFEIDLSVIADLHAAIADGADLAFASRTRGRVGGFARVQSELFNRAVSLASGRRFDDVASETRALRCEVGRETPLYGDFYRYLPLLAERLGFRVAEIPARQHPRATSPVVHAPRIYFWRAIDVLSIFFISRFTRHPLRLFGGVGSAFAAIGALILLVAAIQRLGGTPLGDRPILVLGTLLVGLGVQAFTIGLLGELILFFHARDIRDYRIAAVHEANPPPLDS